ncbi:replication restart helicase PriA [Candidatus Phytoplasma oryzae]|nr:primosomal protein N' [Candidatus Phytoplasma oryzae]
MFAEILLYIKKSNLNILFDYIIPNNLTNLAKKGMRVIVPFGEKNTPRLGYILNIKNKSNMANKYIYEIPDKKPFLNEELLLLAEEILKIPFVSKTSAYNKIIPNGFLVSYKKKIFPLKKDLIPEEIKKYLEKKKWCLETQNILLKDKCFKKLIKEKIIESKIIIQNFYKESEKESENIKIIQNKNNKKLNNQFLYKSQKFSLKNQKYKYKEVLDKINFNFDEKYLLYYENNEEKINFYLKIIEKNQKNNKQVLILVPEIIVVDYILKKIKKKFPYTKITNINSLLSKKKNYIQNKNIKEQKISIVIGTRSAIFAPLEKLGTIIIDDEHDYSLIEKKKINYDPRELAKIRSDYNKIPLILTSNSPSLESYYFYKKNKYKFLNLSKKKNNLKMKLIDMKEELKKGNLSPFSDYLMKNIILKINKKEKILLFINNRGFSPFILCSFCGNILKCLKCRTYLTFFIKNKILKCCFCNYEKKFDYKCLFCQKKTLKNISFGIEYIEYFLKKKFDNKIKILRIDSDSVSNLKEYKKIIKNYKKNEINILLGTEMISKKIELPKISLVGIIMADILLNIPSFKYDEKTFQLITQLSQHSIDKEKIIIQSYNINHYAIKNAANYNINNFLKSALQNRKLSNNPPFVFLSQILIYNKNITNLLKIANKTKSILKENIEANIQVSGPTFPRIFFKKNIYKIFLTLKYKKWPLNLSLVQEYIKTKPGTYIFFDLYANTV